MDLADFGLAPGTRVDALQIIGDCEINPWVESDPAMVAAVDRTCTDSANCEDGDPCTEDVCVMGMCSFPSLGAGSACPEGLCDGAARPRCVECLDDGDCQAPTPRCEVESGACVECRLDGDCPSAPSECLLARCELHVCTATTPQAAGTPCSGGVCSGDPTAPDCVECLSNDDCSTGLCDTLNRRCVECLSDSDCTSDDPCSRSLCDVVNDACRLVPIPGCRPDAGVIADVGVDSGVILDDAGATSPDAASPADPEKSEGCGCTAAHPPDYRGSLAGLVFVLLFRECVRRRPKH